MVYHLDAEFLGRALDVAGPERERLRLLADSSDEIQMSAVAWYELARGQRSPQQLAVVREAFLEGGIIPFSEELALRSGHAFRWLEASEAEGEGEGERVAVATTAAAMGATLLTGRPGDYAGFPDLQVEG